MKKNLAVFR